MFAELWSLNGRMHGEPHALATDFAIQIFPRSLQEAYCLRECCWQFKTTFSVQYELQCVVKNLQQSTFTHCAQSNISGQNLWKIQKPGEK